MLVAVLDRLESSSPAAVTIELWPPPPAPPCGMWSIWHSVETLVVVLAVITMAAVIVGVFVRACDRRHLAGSGDRDVEGWVDSRCRSCLEAGIPPPPSEAKK